jgi:DNA-binding MarR family transcriptional regulator
MTVPPRDAWPEHPPVTPTVTAMTDLILETFRLNARLMDAAQALAAEGEITAAWWQVLGGVLDEPRTLAETGRRMGVSRQAVRRIADLLVQRGLAEYRPNPNHRRAQLLACTEAGYWAVRRISLAQAPWAERIGGAVGVDALRQAQEAMQHLVRVLEDDLSAD